MTCGKVVMRVKVPMRTKKKSVGVAKHLLRITLCRRCDHTNMLKNSNTFDTDGVTLLINRRIVETWYVYTALKKLVDGDIEVVTNEDKSVIRLINRHEFIHTDADNYELTTITIDPNDPEDAIA